MVRSLADRTFQLRKRLAEMQGLSNGAGWELLVAAQQTSDETGHLEWAGSAPQISGGFYRVFVAFADGAGSVRASREVQ